ncbi:hypothetical protein [Thermus sp.]|uniref:hypothetical protein n=1 Tax=Thermus sp. TaxID=275 RepID=UPI003D10C698
MRQVDTGPLVGAYYRTGGGSWQALSFSGGQATFTASGDYEVAVRCQAGPGVYTEVYLFKATASQATFSFICEIPRSVNSQTFEVTLPTTIGSYMVQSGDTVLIGPFSGGYTGSNPVSVNTQLPEGQQDVLVTVLRETGGTAPSITPIGYKLVTGLNVQGSGPFTVNATDWHPFVATRSITFNPPSGYQGLAGVLFSNNNMKVATYVGKIDRYGILSLPGTGKYLGLALAWDSSNQLFTLEETGGNDWTPSLPSPWGAGQFSVNGDELTLSYPGAPGYHIFASGLLKDSTSGNDLRTQITVVYSSGDTTTYTLPVVPGLNYALADPATRVVNLTLTVFRNGIGQNVSWAQRNVSFTGSSYTLP